MVTSAVTFILGGLCVVIIMKCQRRLRKLGEEKNHKSISKQTAPVIKSSNCPVYEDVDIIVETNTAYGPVTHL